MIRDGRSVDYGEFLARFTERVWLEIRVEAHADGQVEAVIASTAEDGEETWQPEDGLPALRSLLQRAVQHQHGDDIVDAARDAWRDG